MFKISKQTDYALLMLSYLKDKNDFVTISKVVEKLNLPSKFISKIASILTNNKILESREGVNGGYKLSNNIKKISLYDFLKIFEGELHLTSCFDNNYHCPNEDFCSHKNFFKTKFSKKIIEFLKNNKLLEII